MGRMQTGPSCGLARGAGDAMSGARARSDRSRGVFQPHRAAGSASPGVARMAPKSLRLLPLARGRLPHHPRGRNEPSRRACNLWQLSYCRARPEKISCRIMTKTASGSKVRRRSFVCWRRCPRRPLALLVSRTTVPSCGRSSAPSSCSRLIPSPKACIFWQMLNPPTWAGRRWPSTSPILPPKVPTPRLTCWPSRFRTRLGAVGCWDLQRDCGRPRNTSAAISLVAIPTVDRGR